MNFKRICNNYRSQKITVAKNFEDALRRLTEFDNDYRYFHSSRYARSIEGWRKRLIRDGVPAEDLVHLQNIWPILKEIDQYFPYTKKNGRRDCTLENKTPLFEIAERALAELNEFQKELPALIEKWLASAVEEAGIKV